MTAFHEVRFPTAISWRAACELTRRTEIVVLGSGHEQRNARWRDARRRYEVGYGCRSMEDLHDVIAFFEARMGSLYGFRFRDWSDWKSCQPLAEPAPDDQPIGTGDGARTVWRLVKTYGSGEAATVREIAKPVDGTVRVAVDGTEMTAGWSVDVTTGEIVFDVPPAAGAVITAGYEFDVPVRFETDELRIDMQGFRAGVAPDISLVEIRA